MCLDEDLRKQMGEMAVEGAKAVGYRGAGTIEFLLDGKNFYFMEMNTRIQVEHPVTELVSGIDLVKEQIRVACGEKLPFTQKDIKIKGWAMECRINAEDPENDFRPCPGVIEALNIPGGPGIRVDTHAYSGYSIPPFYDSMIAKLIAYGKDRDATIRIMLRALDEFLIENVKTTVDFHKKVLMNPAFRSGDISTHFIEKFFPKKEEKYLLPVGPGCFVIWIWSEDLTREGVYEIHHKDVYIVLYGLNAFCGRDFYLYISQRPISRYLGRDD